MMNEPINVDDRDVVLSRLLDGRGRAADWKRLREATATDAAVWDRVIGCATDQDVLGEAVGMAGDHVAEMNLLSAPGCADVQPVPLVMPRADGRRADRAVRSARLGWLVAACMALGLVSLSLKPRGGGGGEPSGVNTAGLINFDKLTASDMMNGYKERASKDGTLVAEMPQRVVLETRPAAGGKGYEVLYMRQFIERAIVDDLYKLGVDDTGRPVMVPTSMEKSRPAGAM